MGIIRRELFGPAENMICGTFDVLSHPARVKIIFSIYQQGSMALHEITDRIGLSQSSTSAQVKKLKEYGVLDATESGTAVYYSINESVWNQMKWRVVRFLDEATAL